MGNHRAARGSRRSASADRATRKSSTQGSAAGGARRASVPTERAVDTSATSTGSFAVVASSATEPGKRRATKQSSGRNPLRGVPSVPVLAGAAALAISVGGALAGPGLVGDNAPVAADLSAANSVSAATAQALAGRDQVVSRDSRREQRSQANEAKLLAEAEAAANARSKELADLNVEASKEAAKIKANLWHSPVSNYRLSATFGMSSYLWSTVHTGLDFAAPSGTPLMAVANGTITEVGSAGSYGIRTILTLEDGTEIWYCHQSSVSVSVGQTVTGGQTIGTVGSTGNSTGPHLHLEVRPGGGNPVDPYTALIEHGIQP